MAHELMFTNGKAACFSSGRVTPWHGEGHVLDGHPSYHEAMQLVGFNYPMVKLPYHRPVEQPDGTEVMIQSSKRFSSSGPDTKQILGNVGSDYEIVSNEVAFSPLQPLVDQGVLKLETGGALALWCGCVVALPVVPEQVRLRGQGRFRHRNLAVCDRDGQSLGSSWYPARLYLGEGNLCQLFGRRRAVMASAVGHKSTTVRVPSLVCSRLRTKMFNRVVERFDIIARQYRLRHEDDNHSWHLPQAGP